MNSQMVRTILDHEMHAAQIAYDQPTKRHHAPWLVGDPSLEPPTPSERRSKARASASVMDATTTVAPRWRRHQTAPARLALQLLVPISAIKISGVRVSGVER
jgi:hypothetical protein